MPPTVGTRTVPPTTTNNFTPKIEETQQTDDVRSTATINGDTSTAANSSTPTTAPRTPLSINERLDARARFTSETGAQFRQFQLQAQLTNNDPQIDPFNSSPIGALGSATRAAMSPPPGVPTLGDVHRAIQGFSRDPNIPFSYVQDGCYARAEEMARALESRGIPTSKIWAHAQDWTKPLEVPGAEWGYHVAPQVRAWNPETGKIGDYVIDPSMSGKPMTPAEWVGKMNPRNGPVQVEVTGTDAYLPDGTGRYIPKNDPEVARWNMGPEETIRNYNGELTSRGLPPNSGPPDGVPTDLDVAASNTGKYARLGSAVSRGLGVVAAVGGGFQVANGVNEWQKGNKLDGGVDVVSGGLNVAGGAALATGVGAVAAPFLFGASSIIDGGRDLYHGINDGNTEKTVVGGAKVAGGGMMVAGGVLCATGVGLPVGAALIAGGAIVSGGAALYDAFHEPINRAVSNTVSAVKDTVSNAWNTVTSWF